MITAKIISNSINEFGDKLTTIECVYPRIVHSEVMTHRMLSKNSASSRAIPFYKMVQSVLNNPFIPIAWQKEHKGMQGSEYFDNQDDISGLTEEWLIARDNAISVAIQLSKSGTTKQLANRLLEPFMYHKVLISGTDSSWQNFFELRCPQYGFTFETDEINPNTRNPKYDEVIFKSWKDVINYDKMSIGDSAKYDNFNTLDRLKVNKGMAEIHMMALAEAIYDEYQSSSIDRDSTWHLPYADESRNIQDNVYISTARCARTSYTTPNVSVDDSLNLEKDIQLHDRLLLNKPPHASPAEHPARKMTNDKYFSFQKVYIVNQLTEKLYNENALGKTQIIALSDDCYRIIEYGWCNNYRGFIQYRYLIENNLPI